MTIDLFGPNSSNQNVAPSAPIDLFKNKLPMNNNNEPVGMPYSPTQMLAGGILSRLAPKSFGSMVKDIPFAPLNRQPTSGESAMMGTGEMIPDVAVTSMIPPLRLTKFVPGASNLAKGILNYGTDIAQNAGLMGLLNATQGKSAGEGAIAGGASTAVINPILQGIFSRNPIVRLTTAGLAAAGATAAGQKLFNGDSTTADIIGGGIGAGLALRGKNAKDLAAMQLLEHVDMKKAIPVLQAAKRIGLRFIRPSEATGSGYIGGIEGGAGKTPQGSLLLERESDLRRASENTAIKKLYKNTFKNEPGEDSQTVSALYTKAGQSDVSPQFFNSVTESATMREAMNRVENNPVHQDRLNGITRTKFAYLDEVKRALDAMHNEAVTKGVLGDAEHIDKIRRNLINKMDSINPEYKIARNLSERQITVREMRKAMRSSEIKGIPFYQKFYKNEEKYNEVYHSLRNAPDAQKQFADMKIVFKDLVDSGSENARSAVKLKKTGMSEERSSAGYYQRLIHFLQGAKYDKAMVELMTNPKWFLEVKRAKEMTKPNEKLRFVTNLISRASASALEKNSLKGKSR